MGRIGMVQQPAHHEIEIPARRQDDRLLTKYRAKVKRRREKIKAYIVALKRCTSLCQSIGVFHRLCPPLRFAICHSATHTTHTTTSSRVHAPLSTFRGPALRGREANHWCYSCGAVGVGFGGCRGAKNAPGHPPQSLSCARADSLLDLHFPGLVLHLAPRTLRGMPEAMSI